MRVLRDLARAMLATVIAGAASAQTGTLVGTVLDSSGAAIAGASVEVRNSATHEVQLAETDPRGEFIVANLAAGTYDVRIAKEGFQTLRQNDLHLDLEQEARMEFRLSLGAITQTVEVQAMVPLLNTENAKKGEVMASQEVVEMPLNGRDFTDLAALTPGVMPKQQGGAGSAFAINGARADNTNFVIDGFNDQNPRGAAAQARPNLDALEEFNMQTSGYSAETGRLAGGVLTMVLKSGSNAVHGVMFEFLRNEFADARGFFDTSTSRLRRNQFGGTVSGPFLVPKIYDGHNRTFFLFSWESQRQEQGQVKLGIVPSQEKAGDFSAFGVIKDPLANSNFPGRQIPLSRMSSAALQAQAFFPAPNRPGQANNYQAYTIAPNDWDADVIKLDHRFSVSDSLSYRWLKRYNRSEDPYNNSDLGTFGQSVRSHQTLTGLVHTHIFSPGLINEARLGFSRTDEVDRASTEGFDYNTQFGLPSPLDPRLTGFPLFTITNYEKLGNGANLPVHFTVNNFEVSDSMTVVKAMHVVKFGVNILRTQFFQPYFNNNRGTFNFLGRWTNQPYADFLLGLPDSTSHQTGTSTNYMLSSNISAFLQDDWKIASRLTLNLGLRYELPRPMYDKYDRYTNFVPEIGKLVLASDATLAGAGVGFSDPSKVTTAKAAGLGRSLVFPNYQDVAPRFGMAWRPFGGAHTVVRGGYGIFYGGGILNDMRNNLANVFPFAISQTFNRQTTNVNYLTLANPFPAPPNLTGNVVNVNGIEIHARTPNLQSWNLTLERTIGLASAIEIGYVGSKGTHLGRYYNINQPFRSADTAPNFPVPYAGFSTINYYGFNANSTFNSGSVSLRRRFSDGFFYRLNYTYAKSIDDTSQLNGAGSGGYAGVQNVRNLHGDRGRSDWDLGHSVTGAFSWTAPRQKRLLLRGWQLAGTTILQSGQPFTPQVNNVNLNLGEANRPDRIAKGTVPNPTPDRWYDVGAFPVLPTGSYRFGDSGRNILDGPGTIQVNGSVYRNFMHGERSGWQFRWEVFNVLNHPNLHLPAVNVNAPNAATITSAGDPRLMQFGLRYWF